MPQPITDAEWAAYWRRYDLMLEIQDKRPDEPRPEDFPRKPVDEMRSLHIEAARMTGGAI